MQTTVARGTVKKFILLAAIVATQSHASKWVEFVINSPDNPGAISEVDVESLKSKFGFLRAWVRTTSDTPSAVPGTLKKAKSLMYLAWMDCALNKFAISEHYYFSDINFGGQVVSLTDLRFSQEAIAGAMSPITPDIMTLKLKELICSMASQSE